MLKINLSPAWAGQQFTAPAPLPRGKKQNRENGQTGGGSVDTIMSKQNRFQPKESGNLK